MMDDESMQQLSELRATLRLFTDMFDGICERVELDKWEEG